MASTVWSSEERADLLDRVLRQLRRSQLVVAEEIRSIGPGWSVRTPSLPWVWSLNQLRIAEPVTFPDVVALADEHLDGLPYRHVVVEHEATADLLQASFLSAGWTFDREVLMVLAEPPDRPAGTRAIAEMTEDAMVVLMRRWIKEERDGVSAEALDQIEEYNRREGRALGERRFGFVGDDGAPLAITKLRVDGTTGWVEDVYTSPEARGRGYARALVTNAAALAKSEGSELTFIVADDNDWPKDLYARIGFRPIGRTKTFHKDLRAAS
jgi:ribosomal protein S18 acetylase RimI-like enzyme